MRKFDYDFWIQAMIRLLFIKRKQTSSWMDALRAFNGSAYRKRVTNRLTKVKGAAKAGKLYPADKI
jgi:hypothetical protein